MVSKLVELQRWHSKSIGNNKLQSNMLKHISVSDSNEDKNLSPMFSETLNFMTKAMGERKC